ncbi:MAG: aminotransferase class I/II-fold pyridoxal phosphate-dependent enzyme, partial [Acidimicrobiia bacterium]|nr:aminotransferase class I/II-fold pyridoxal phosphate-dependent enzyme [Acidimicrobiia bacterium]
MSHECTMRAAHTFHNSSIANDDIRSLLRDRYRADDGATLGFYRRRERAFSTGTHRSFLSTVYATARSFRTQGLRTGEIAVIATPGADHTCVAFLAAITLGAIPTVMAVRPAFDDPTTANQRLDRVLAALPGTPAVIIAEGGTPPPASRDCRFMHLPTDVTGIDTQPIQIVRPATDDIAYLQLSSGSTGTPQPIAITHRALIANNRSLEDRVELESTDVFLAWLPLYHDMGLTAFFLLPLALGANFHILTPFDFLGDPAVWIQCLSDTRATVTASPNFGYRHASERARDSRLVDIDLSSLRRAYCGAEPVSGAAMRDFYNRFGPLGLRPDAVMPTYGMAETTLMLTMPVMGSGLRSMAIPRTDVLSVGTVPPGTAGSITTSPLPAADVIEICSVGPPAADVDMWLIDSDGNPLEGERRCGEIVVRCPSLGAGYLRPDGSVDAFDAAGFRTGDIGYFDGGDLFIVDRIKNTIIRNGQSISAQVLEDTLSDVIGCPVDQVLMVDSDVTSDSGRLTAIIELRRDADPTELYEAVLENIERFEPPIEDLVFVRPGSIPRTTSGKKRHAEARQQLISGDLRIAAMHALPGPLALRDGPDEVDPGLVIDLVALETTAEVRDTVRLHAIGRGLDTPIEDTTRFGSDLGFDSLAMYELAMAIEERLAIQLDEADLAELRTVDDLARIALERHRSPRPRTSGITASIAAASRPLPQIFNHVEDQKGRKVLIDGRWVSDFASCNYLGLDLHPSVIDAIEPAVRKWGLHPSWTRAIASPAPYRELEHRLADLIGVPDTVVFPTVTLVHMGVLPSLAGSGGTILIDRAAHNSLRQATDLAQAHGTAVTVFDHSDLAELETKLAVVDAGGPKIIVVDGVYSMSGEAAPLTEMLPIAERHDATIYVDDAHGFGILGEGPTPEAPYGHRGNGAVRHLGLGYDRIVYVAGLSKAYSSMGAFISAASPEQRKQFETASTMVFSGPVPIASLASALAGLDVNDSEGELLRSRLHALTTQLMVGLSDLGLAVDNGHDFPIVNIEIGDVESTRAAA